MKVWLLIVMFLSLANYACQSGSPAVNLENKTVSSPQNMNQQTTATKKFDDLEIVYKINFAPNRSLEIDYTIKNTGAENYVVFNQGHTNRRENDATYVEEKDKTIEFSQKAFSKPAGVMCPNSLVPVVPRGALLKAGAELNGRAKIVFPLQTFTPFDFCVAPQPVDADAAQARFCLGAAKAGAANVKIDEKGNVENVNSFVAKQNILCSDSIKL